MEVYLIIVPKIYAMIDMTKIIEKSNPTNRNKDKFPSNMSYDGIIFFLDDKGIIKKIRIY
jgi:hypothetical protein